MNARGIGSAVGCAIVLAGCGGGGGGGSTPAPQAAYVSPTSDYVQGQAITPVAPTVTGSATSFSAAPALPAGLALDPGTGVVSGTPTAGAAEGTYTITVTGAGGSTTSTLRFGVEPVATVSRMAVAGTTVYPTVTLDTTALGLSGTVYAKLVDANDIFAAPVTVSANGASSVLELGSIGSAAPGVHAGQAVVSLCKDAACTQPQATPTLLVNYSLAVLAPGGAWAGNHLTTLASMAGAPEWATFQGNAAHTGYVPVALDPNQFSTRWQLGVPSFLYFNGVFNLATVTTAKGSFYIAGNNAVTAHSEFDGSTTWSYSFAGLQFPSVNPPAVSNGTVYVAAGQQSSTYMFGLDAVTGTVKFRSAMSSQWEDYLAPTVGAAGVYTDAGGYGGVYGFDTTGDSLFVGGTAQQSAWTPAVDANGVYAYTGDALHVFDPVTGTVKATITDPTFTNYIYEIGGSAVLGAPNSVFAAAYGNSWLNGGGIGNALVHFNLKSNSVDWSIHGVYPSTPAYDSAVVYVANTTRCAWKRATRLTARWPGPGRRRPRATRSSSARCC